MNTAPVVASSLYSKKRVSPTTLPGVSPMIPPEILLRLSREPESCFAITPLVAIVDDKLPDKALRIRDLIAACSWKTHCPLAFGDIAVAVRSSRPQVIRHINLLEARGYIEVFRRGNRCNLYSAVVQAPVGSATAAPASKPLIECPRCRKSCKMLLRKGWCHACNWKDKVRHVVREEVARTA